MQEADYILTGLFKGYFPKAVASLVRIFGARHISLAEEVVQESLLRAVKVWRVNGIPANPEAWLYQTARNLAIDVLRREKNLELKKKEIAYKLAHAFYPSQELADPAAFRDDLLKLLFIACHPLLPYESQLCLTLKIVAGLSVEEIARAFFCSPETIAQRIVRAKRKIKEAGLGFKLPPAGDLTTRTDAVLNVIYLLYNEGYSALQGQELVKVDICKEAIRLACLLVEQRIENVPKAHALLALMYLQSSRLPARIAEDGSMVLLPDQDRNLWDQTLIRHGMYHLHLAGHGTELSPYHLQAGIAACHCLAKSYAETNWPGIVWYYQELICQNPSPVFALNQAIALSFVEGATAALAALQALQTQPKLQSYYLYHTALADMLMRCHQKEQAIESYVEALSLARTAPEKAFLMKKLASCNHPPASAYDPR
jgi:RNA polymerase sigma-70 factor (ECF subfamily)